MLIQHKAGTLLMTLVTLVGAGVVSELETSVIKEGPQQVEILRNHLSLAWVAGGAVLGGYVAVAIRHYLTEQSTRVKTMTWPGMVHYLAVSICSSLAFTPYALRRWYDGHPEECFFGGFVVALGSWIFYEVALIIVGRLKEAARKRGWLGIKDELLAGKQAIVDQMVNPPVTPPAMPRAPESPS